VIIVNLIGKIRALMLVLCLGMWIWWLLSC